MKRTALKRKTPLRAKQWGITKSTKSTNRKRAGTKELGETRPLVLQRERGRCELCGEPIRGDEWEDHHVFYRSHLWARIRHETWNRAPLHFPCHRAAHNRPGARYLLEAKAVSRLYQHLGPQQIPEVLALLPEGATAPAAFVEAYAQHVRRRPAS